MKLPDEEGTGFNVTDKFKTRALELLDESQAVQFVEALRLNNALAVVFDREERRLRNKYGEDDERTREMAVRVEASTTAKVDLFARYTDAMTSPPRVTKGWTVDGFVRATDGTGLGSRTVASYDAHGNLLKDLGRALTDERGYFSINVEKLPERVPREVFMRASMGRTLLPSNEVTVVPRAGASARVELIIRDKDKDHVPGPGQDDTQPAPPNPRHPGDTRRDQPDDAPESAARQRRNAKGRTEKNSSPKPATAARKSPPKKKPGKKKS